MEQNSELERNSPPQANEGLPGGFAPRISETMAELLVTTVAGTAKMVQVSLEAQKSAQLACFHAEHALTQARLSYMAARGLAERLLGFLSPPDFQGLFQLLSQPPMSYSEFCTIIRRTENALLHPVLKCKPGFPGRREPSPSSDFSRLPDIAEDGLRRGMPDLQFLKSPSVSETQDEDDGTDEEEKHSGQSRGRNPSRHKQIETVLLEDQMRGTYGTPCRRSPRRSPSAGIEGLSPLVSKQDLNSIQPVICCPSRQGGSGKFLSKVTRHKDQSQRENSDSDTDRQSPQLRTLDRSTTAKDAG